MDWIKNFIIPLIEIVFAFGIIGSLLFIIIRAIRKVWLKHIKWIFKYEVLNKDVNQEDINIIVGSGKNEIEMTKSLLLEGNGMYKVDEIMYLFKKMKNIGGK